MAQVKKFKCQATQNIIYKTQWAYGFDEMIIHKERVK